MTLAALALCAWVFALWWISQMNSARDFAYTVSAIIPGEVADHPYGVEVAGNHPGFSFRRPPGLSVGDEIVARYDRAGQYLGWSHDGRFTPRLHQPSKVVFVLPVGLAITLTAVTVYIARGERVPQETL
jgi:hypothetical protein